MPPPDHRQPPEIGRVLVVGGTGRLGTLLRRGWDIAGQGGLCWQRRGGAGAGGPVFDPLGDPAAYAEAAAGADAILSLAGRVSAEDGDLARHGDLALAALAAARAAGVPRVFIASSAAVYGPARRAKETDAPAPHAPYGAAKVRMEQMAQDWCRQHPGAPALTLLRIGNVAGADMLLAPRGHAGPQPLDTFADGTTPLRSYIGPQALAGQIAALMALGRAGGPLPAVVNLALEGPVAMDALLTAAGRTWVPQPAPPAALREVSLDLSRLRALIGPVAAATAKGILADLGGVAGAVA